MSHVHAQGLPGAAMSAPALISATAASTWPWTYHHHADTHCQHVCGVLDKDMDLDTMFKDYMQCPPITVAVFCKEGHKFAADTVLSSAWCSTLRTMQLATSRIRARC